MQSNYHTHCKLCGHAEGLIEDYIKEALANDFTTLGMSDHIPYQTNDLGECMDYENLDFYIREAHRLKDLYRDKIKFHVGLESEYLPEYRSYYEDLLENRGIEYMILGVHFFHSADRMANSFGGIISTEEYISYANCVVEAMKTGMYKYIAHPDLIMMSPFPVDDNVRKALDIIIDCVVKNDYIVEYNVNGLRRGQREYREGPRYPYPYNPFWEEIAKTRAKVIIGADCHSPRLLNDSYVKMAEDDVKRLNLNIITDIDI